MFSNLIDHWPGYIYLRSYCWTSNILLQKFNSFLSVDLVFLTNFYFVLFQIFWQTLSVLLGHWLLSVMLHQSSWLLWYLLYLYFSSYKIHIWQHPDNWRGWWVYQHHLSIQAWRNLSTGQQLSELIKWRTFLLRKIIAGCKSINVVTIRKMFQIHGFSADWSP